MGVLVKICGIKSTEEANIVCAAEFNGRKVDYLGLIFATSKRKVSKEIARDISKIAHKHSKKAVGVFTDASDEEIVQIVDFCALDAVQIHSIVDDKSRFKCPVWQVFSIKDKLIDLDGSFDLAMFDAKGELAGGNGISFEWDVLLDLRFKFALAGGIGIENVQKALSYKPFLIDINSRVENEFGIKDPAKIEEILKIISLGVDR